MHIFIDRSEPYTTFPEWNVFYESFNDKKIKYFNIFDNTALLNYTIKAAKKFKDDRAAFEKEIEGWLSYYYWSKCEWEVVITSWPPRDGVEQKIDVYDQVMINHDRFFDYLWENRAAIAKLKVVK